jgi:copper(I)-binding protein
MPLKMKNTLAAALLGCLAWLPVHAANVGVDQAWARATVPGQPVGAVYLVIESDADARLIGAASPLASRVEVHEMKMDGSVMRMQEVKAIDLPKGKSVTLEPGGLHLMLMNLKKPIAPGEVIPVVLTVESGGKLQTIEVRAQARAVGGAMPHARH